MQSNTLRTGRIPSETPPHPPGRKVLLVVDDEPDILTSLEDLIGLRMPGVRVVTAASGAKGMVIVLHGPVDMILSDFHMPVMDGVEFLKRARQIQADIPMVIMTADANPEIMAEALKHAKVKILLPKPLEPELIIEMVDFFLGKIVPLAGDLGGFDVRAAKPPPPAVSRGST